MRLTPQPAARRGAVLAEAALFTSVFLLIVLGMIDLGIGAFRYNAISQAARHGTRRAIVHGYLSNANPNIANPNLPWGPTTAGPLPASGSGHPIIAEIRPMLFTCDLDDTQITVAWPDGNNKVESRVRVTITTQHQPFLLTMIGMGPIPMSATSTMPIAH